eukprot:TRINITY_DN7832_c0_g1_i2.p1 TRINITY_DN7832_c0_g1~~TRINITY_DN7832_c0_g1_i2.p1  ORF type:complete len:182 (+),score=26.35 TRINITY_DN7832_c0_g1_i2:62-547(+)
MCIRDRSSPQPKRAHSPYNVRSSTKTVQPKIPRCETSGNTIHGGAGHLHLTETSQIHTGVSQNTYAATTRRRSIQSAQTKHQPLLLNHQPRNLKTPAYALKNKGSANVAQFDLNRVLKNRDKIVTYETLLFFRNNDKHFLKQNTLQHQIPICSFSEFFFFS